jgi:EAL domain-containing protein (putative c-di-GMP-specific phosphodiesterase class I)
VSINLSGREFCFDQPAVTMQQALARNSIDPRLLEIEITETVLMEDVENAAETLNDDLEHDESDRAICQAMISVARGLNMEVVAEGIETEYQVRFLQDAGCQIGQGFLLDKPMKTGDFIERLKSPNTPIIQTRTGQAATRHTTAH